MFAAECEKRIRIAENNERIDRKGTFFLLHWISKRFVKFVERLRVYPSWRFVIPILLLKFNHVINRFDFNIVNIYV